ncbi:hypothetical protein DFJ73DRAFT_857233 [Zopfochytrium polystomum]|nr:hypothetical protein DFJ73DRAFT_857233 [Zopfochytrium polystomum]
MDAIMASTTSAAPLSTSATTPQRLSSPRAPVSASLLSSPSQGHAGSVASTQQMPKANYTGQQSYSNATLNSSSTLNGSVKGSLSVPSGLPQHGQGTSSSSSSSKSSIPKKKNVVNSTSSSSAKKSSHSNSAGGGGSVAQHQSSSAQALAHTQQQQLNSQQQQLGMDVDLEVSQRSLRASGPPTIRGFKFITLMSLLSAFPPIHIFKDPNSPGSSKMNFALIDDKFLRRYRRISKMKISKPLSSREELVHSITKHFHSQELNEKDAITHFIYALRNQGVMWKAYPPP